MNNQKEELEIIRKKVIENIKENYPKSEAEEYISNIELMDKETFIDFLKKQGIIEDEKNESCIFCSMISGQIPTTKIEENNNAIAILELNPVSKGHSLIIPKKHVNSKEEFPLEGNKLATEIKNKLENNFSPKRVDLISSNVMGHQIINVLPIYEEETINSERKKETKESLEKIKEEILKEEKKEEIPEIIEEPKIRTINKNEMILPKRIP